MFTSKCAYETGKILYDATYGGNTHQIHMVLTSHQFLVPMVPFEIGRDFLTYTPTQRTSIPRTAVCIYSGIGFYMQGAERRREKHYEKQQQQQKNPIQLNRAPFEPLTRNRITHSHSFTTTHNEKRTIENCAFRTNTPESSPPYI